MFERVFLTHPRSIGETYLEHQKAAFGFAGTLFLASCACALHGMVPALFKVTGSTMVKRLYERMVLKRHRTAVHSVTETPFADYAI